MKKGIICVLLCLVLLGIASDTVKADCIGNCEILLAGGNTYSKMQCGDSVIPYMAAQIVRTIILILQVATPIIIIIFGMLDVVKAVMAQKEDEIKKGQQTFIKRLIVGVSVFLVFFVVEIAIGLIAPKKENPDMWNCIDCFVNGDCDSVRIN